MKFKNLLSCVSSVFPSTPNSGENYKRVPQFSANCLSITQNQGAILTISEGPELLQLMYGNSSCLQSLHANHLHLPPSLLLGPSSVGHGHYGGRKPSGARSCQPCLPSTLPLGVQRGASEVRRLWFTFILHNGQGTGSLSSPWELTALIQYTCPTALPSCSGPWIPLSGLFLWVRLISAFSMKTTLG